MMKAVEISAPGGPDVLRLVERAAPVAGAGEALIRVAASGINRPDVLQRKGVYPPPPGASDLPGLEVAGRIEGGDADALAAAGFALGDRVCALVAGGGYTELCVAPIGQCLPVPGVLSDVEAASLPETFFTVWSNVFDRARLQPGETLLIQGGTHSFNDLGLHQAHQLADELHLAALALEVGDAFGIRNRVLELIGQFQAFQQVNAKGQQGFAKLLQFGTFAL